MYDNLNFRGNTKVRLVNKKGPGRPKRGKSKLEELEEAMASLTDTEVEESRNSKGKAKGKQKSKASTNKKNCDIIKPKSQQGKNKGCGNKKKKENDNKSKKGKGRKTCDNSKSGKVSSNRTDSANGDPVSEQKAEKHSDEAEDFEENTQNTDDAIITDTGVVEPEVFFEVKISKNANKDVEDKPVLDNLDDQKDTELATSTNIGEGDARGGTFQGSTPYRDTSDGKNTKSGIVEIKTTPIDENLFHEKDTESASTKMPECEQTTEGKFQGSTQNSDAADVKNAESSIVEATFVDENLNQHKDSESTSTKMPDCDQTLGNFQAYAPNRDASYVDNAKNGIVEGTTVNGNLNNENNSELTSPKMSDRHPNEGKFEESTLNSDVSYVFENAKSIIVGITPVDDNLKCDTDAESISIKMPDCDKTQGEFEGSTEKSNTSLPLNAKSIICEATPVDGNLKRDTDADSTSTKIPDCDKTEGNLEESTPNPDPSYVFENAKSIIVENTPVDDNLKRDTDAESISNKMPDCDRTQGEFEGSTKKSDASDPLNEKSSICEATPVDGNLNRDTNAESTSTKIPDCDKTERSFEKSTQKSDASYVFENAKSIIVENTHVDDNLKRDTDAESTSTKIPDCDQTEGKFVESIDNSEASDVKIVEAAPVEEHKDAELTSTKKQDCDQTERNFQGCSLNGEASAVENAITEATPVYDNLNQENDFEHFKDNEIQGEKKSYVSVSDGNIERNLPEQQLEMPEKSEQGFGVNNFMINVTGSIEEEKYQTEISMSVNDIIDTLSSNDSVEKFMDTKEEERRSNKKECGGTLTDSIMSKMEEFMESNTVDSMELYRLRQNDIAVSATTASSSDEEQITIRRRKPSSKRKKKKAKEK